MIAPQPTSSKSTPNAHNTKQFRWIVLIKENIDLIFANNPEAFVAGDLLWHPVKGHPEIRVVPDIVVALGRQKGDRSHQSYGVHTSPPREVFKSFICFSSLQLGEKGL